LFPSSPPAQEVGHPDSGREGHERDAGIEDRVADDVDRPLVLERSQEAEQFPAEDAQRPDDSLG
jgi:hypothetical protein